MKNLSGRICLCICLALVICAPPVWGKMYRWVDENGEIRVTNTPPPASVPEKKKETRREVRRQFSEDNEVELYVTSWCPYCKKAKAFFRQIRVPFKAYDVEKDPAAAARKKKLDTRSGVPFAVINGVHVHGFAPDEYVKALK